MLHLDELIQKVLNVKDKLSLQNLKSELLGKNSQINQEFKKLGSLSEEERKEKASSLNSQKQKITEAIDNKFKELEKLEINQKIKKDKVDVTLPVRELPNGKTAISRPPNGLEEASFTANGLPASSPCFLPAAARLSMAASGVHYIRRSPS